MTARFDAEVIVVGGGPAGATLAFFLARAGCDVLVVDRARFPRDKPCSEYLSPPVARLLEELGALGAVERSPSARLAGMRVVAPGGRAFEGRFAAVRGFRAFRPYGLAVRRRLLDALLLDRARAAGATVVEGAGVRDLWWAAPGRAGGVEVHTPDGARTWRAPLIVGADGLRSVVARRAGLGRHGRRPRRVAFVSHLRGAPVDPDMGEMHVFHGGYAGFAPVGGGLTNVALVVPAARAASARGDASAFMRRTLLERDRLARRIAGAEWELPVRVVGPFNWRARRAWSPGLALVGDAADFFDPFTGEGIHTAMRGAELLATYAWEAARSADRRRADLALAAYDRCRRDEFRGKWAVERIVAAAVGAPWLMDRAAEGLARDPALADLLVGVTGDFVPASEVLGPRYILRLLAAALHRSTPPPGSVPEPAPTVPRHADGS